MPVISHRDFMSIKGDFALTADWGKNPLMHQGSEPASVWHLAFQSDALPTEPHPTPHDVGDCMVNGDRGFPGTRAGPWAWLAHAWHEHWMLCKFTVILLIIIKLQCSVTQNLATATLGMMQIHLASRDVNCNKMGFWRKVLEERGVFSKQFFCGCAGLGSATHSYHCVQYCCVHCLASTSGVFLLCCRLKLFLEPFGVPSCVLNSELPVSSR